ncbi:MAG: TolB protein [Gaiellaceae bacterium]|jgi:TolB protein|nr:TolB protein [Gaiellaceae bacterium]
MRWRARHSWLLVGVSVALAVIVVSVALVTGNDASSQLIAFPVFVSEHPPRAHVDVVAMDGTGRGRLTRSARSGLPAWSPGGQRLAFVAWGRSNEIRVSEADGSHELRVTHGHYDAYPAWSPDGRRIAFLREGSGIAVVSADGSDAHVIATAVHPFGPLRWAPDGRRLAYSMLLGRSLVVVIVDTAGAGFRRVLTAGAEPDWAPDGQRLAVVTPRAALHEIDVMKADGSHRRRVSNPSIASQNAGPAWSPDGRWIAFECGDELCVVRPDGRGQRVLTHGAFATDGPSWSPDGTLIAYQEVDREHGVGYLAVIRPDGTRRKRLAQTDGSTFVPTWRPPTER